MINKIKRYSLLIAIFGGCTLMSSVANAQTLGDLFDRISSQDNAYELVSYIAYLAGFLFTAVGVHKLRQHVEYGPQKVELPEPLKYLFTAGLMLTLPMVATVASQTFGDQGDAQAINGALYWNSSTSQGLDGMMIRVMENIYGPVQLLILFFCYVAGAILTMVAIHRFTKTAQEGPRGPTGMGTIATFVLAGVLFSIAPTIGMLAETLFENRDSMNHVQFLSLEEGSDAQMHAEDVATAIIVFLTIVGILAIVRGLFVLRGVAEGNQQMTMMSGISHVVAGAILVNFGQFANIIQTTLGIDSFGVQFT